MGIGTIMLLLLEAVVFCILLFTFIFLVQAMIGAPWVRTRNAVSRAMLAFAGVNAGEIVLDLGSGDGSIALVASREFGAHGYGIEYQWPLVGIAHLRRLMRLGKGTVTLIRGNMLTHTWPNADVVTCFLSANMNRRLEPLFLERLKSGTRIVSRTFHLEQVPLVATETLPSGEKMYLYQIP